MIYLSKELASSVVIVLTKGLHLLGKNNGSKAAAPGYMENYVNAYNWKWQFISNVFSSLASHGIISTDNQPTAITIGHSRLERNPAGCNILRALLNKRIKNKTFNKLLKIVCFPHFLLVRIPKISERWRIKKTLHER